MVDVGFAPQGGGLMSRARAALGRAQASWHHDSLVAKYHRLAAGGAVVALARSGRVYDVVTSPPPESDMWGVKCLPDTPHLNLRSGEIDDVLYVVDALHRGLLAA